MGKIKRIQVTRKPEVHLGCVCVCVCQHHAVNDMAGMSDKPSSEAAQ